MTPTTPALGFRRPDDAAAFGQDDFNFNTDILDRVIRPVYNARAAVYGAVGDGVADDTAKIQAALTAGAGREVLLPAGTYKTTATLTVPSFTRLRLDAGATIACALATGADAILLDHAAEITGERHGSGSSVVKAVSGANVGSLIRNVHVDASQEYAYVEGLMVTADSGAVVACGIKFVSLYVNSGIRDTIVGGNNTITNGIIITGGTVAGYGPVYLEDVWTLQTQRDCIVVTEDVTAPGSAMAWLTNVTAEHPGSGYNNILIRGHGTLQNVHLRNIHTENGTIAAAPMAAVYIDGALNTTIDGIDVYAAPIANKSGIVITAGTSGTKYRGLTNPNGVSPLVDDRAAGFKYDAVSRSADTPTIFGAAGFSVVDDVAGPVNAASGVSTPLYTFTQSAVIHYVSALVYLTSSLQADGANLSTVVLLVLSDGYHASVVKIAEIIRQAGAADTFTITAAGTGTKTLSVTPTAATVWVARIQRMQS